MEITKEILAAAFEYKEGRIFYKKKFGKMLPGNEAGALSPQGYVNVGIYGKTMRRHQIVYLMFHGVLPDEIDHIDGNKSNDLIANLRGCTHAENMKNKRLDKRNSTGYKGVSMAKKGRNRYLAYISNNNKRFYLGSFPTAKEASIAYEAAAIILFGNYKVQFAQ